MSQNKVNVEGVLLFEQSFVKVPYENYRKVFRTSQKATNDLKDVAALVEGLAKRAKAGADPADALKSLDAAIAKVEAIKRKVTDVHANAGKQTLSVMRERLRHLAVLEPSAGPSTSTVAVSAPPAAAQSTPLGTTLTPAPTTSSGGLDRLDPVFDHWSDVRLDRWLVDWALRAGKERTAKMLAREKGIERMVDIDLFVDIHRIEDALRRHSCTEALAWCNENKSALKKIKSTLEFDLRMQEYIELARQRKLIEAIAYAKKHLVPWHETHLAQTMQLSALLAHPPSTPSDKYQRLYAPSRWTTLTESFRVAIYTLNNLPTQPFLHLALYAGMASLKLPACFDDSSTGPSLSTSTISAGRDDDIAAGNNTAAHMDVEGNTETDHEMADATETQPLLPALSVSSSAPSTVPTHMPPTHRHSRSNTQPTHTRNPDCPICDPTTLGLLARSVPFSHHLNSHIVCPISRRTIDADNPPLAFPVGGCVYGREALEEMARRNAGEVVCPRTSERCAFGSLRRVYIS